MQTSIRHHISFLAACLLVMAITGSCRNDIVWSSSEKVPSDGWLPDEFVQFDLDPSAYDPKPANRFAELTARAVGDTAERHLGVYHATLAIRYLEDCNVSELRLAVEKAGLDEPLRNDTIRIPLFRNDGKPAGKGRFGIYETSLKLYPFTISNGTTVSFSPVAAKDTVRGITDIILLIHKPGKSHNPIRPVGIPEQ